MRKKDLKNQFFLYLWFNIRLSFNNLQQIMSTHTLLQKSIQAVIYAKQRFEK
jgi:hypothetical protein